tara:strand:+ start:4501 stop:4758 length:258 start_codon:yes stop_codon:yes gene_type:complete
MKVNITQDHPILQEIIIKTAELKRFLDTDIIHVSDRKEIIKNLESYEKQHLVLIELLTEKAKAKKQEHLTAWAKYFEEQEQAQQK